MSRGGWKCGRGDGRVGGGRGRVGFRGVLARRRKRGEIRKSKGHCRRKREHKKFSFQRSGKGGRTEKTGKSTGLSQNCMKKKRGEVATRRRKGIKVLQVMKERAGRGGIGRRRRRNRQQSCRNEAWENHRSRKDAVQEEEGTKVRWEGEGSSCSQGKVVR